MRVDIWKTNERKDSIFWLSAIPPHETSCFIPLRNDQRRNYYPFPQYLRIFVFAAISSPVRILLSCCLDIFEPRVSTDRAHGPLPVAMAYTRHPDRVEHKASQHKMSGRARAQPRRGENSYKCSLVHGTLLYQYFTIF